jgi:hypothetical protein
VIVLHRAVACDAAIVLSRDMLWIAQSGLCCHATCSGFRRRVAAVCTRCRAEEARARAQFPHKYLRDNFSGRRRKQGVRATGSFPDGTSLFPSVQLRRHRLLLPPSNYQPCIHKSGTTEQCSDDHIRYRTRCDIHLEQPGVLIC